MTTPPLILASGSEARANMLRACGLDFEIIPAGIDETPNVKSPADLATDLSVRKALSVAAQHRDALVIGSDQVLDFGGEIWQKAKDKAEALKKIKKLSGQTHRLISAASVVESDQVLWSGYQNAFLSMKTLDEKDIRTYADRAGDDLTQCVGAYAIERRGAWLFDKIEGDTFVVQGLPLLPLLSFLKTRGYGP